MLSRDQAQLEQWEAAHGTPQQVALCCRIVLGAFAGQQNQAMAARLVSRPTVNLWRNECGIWVSARSGRWPPDGGETRSNPAPPTPPLKPHPGLKPQGDALEFPIMAEDKKSGRLWRSPLRPPLTHPFHLSEQALFFQDMNFVVGLYLNPPQKALVLCLDEKSQIQALDRRQPGLPLKKGRCGTMTHDYKRNGTTTLFAALNVLDGQVIGECHARHRHQEWLKFLRRLDREFPQELELHLVMDNYGTHQEPHVRAWLQKHRRFVCHFIPTSSSWLNLVERWFEELSEKAIRRGSFVSVPDLHEAIDRFLEAWNQKPKPFIWTAKVEDMIKKIERARAKLEEIKPGCTQPTGKRRRMLFQSGRERWPSRPLVDAHRGR